VYSYPSFYIYSEQTFAQPFCSLYLWCFSFLPERFLYLHYQP
jgi:hypothetical protein